MLLFSDSLAQKAALPEPAMLTLIVLACSFSAFKSPEPAIDASTEFDLPPAEKSPLPLIETLRASLSKDFRWMSPEPLIDTLSLPALRASARISPEPATDKLSTVLALTM